MSEPLDEAPARYMFKPGSVVLDEAGRPSTWWGRGDQILAACGEALLIVGAQGLGKSTLGQQVCLGRAGFPEYSELLGLPITPGRRRVLYLAMDRPRQALRSMRRMVGDSWRAELDARLSVWTGPPPYDMAKHPSILTRLALDADADTVVVDSLKDAAVGLSDDETGAGYNRARQGLLEAGVELVELHHPRKVLNGDTRTKPSIDDAFGSTWITSGAGSVVFLAGSPGDAMVKVFHAKQPLGEVGPLTILHDAESGRSTIAEQTDLVALAKARGQLSAVDAAAALYDTQKPTPADKANARRRLDKLANSGVLMVLDEGDQATNRPRLWGAS